MGYERKRGKLADLNALLRGDAADRFAAIVGDTAILRGVRYVITLDTDTQLPRDAARQLVGAMAHPLNRAVYDSDRQRVCEGYGILQPRVAVSLPGANRSRYARLHGSDAGIDPYTHAVSDVYQDWFQEGSFIGKGIYDVDAFEQALRDASPRTVSSVMTCWRAATRAPGCSPTCSCMRTFPPVTARTSSRRYRWIRGDWQIAQWSLPRVPGVDGRSVKQSALGPVALEIGRQPPAQSGARRPDPLVNPGLGIAGIARLLDPGPAWHRADPGADDRAAEPAAQAG
jgi:cyclic beta-1,2-glucan synthetase